MDMNFKESDPGISGIYLKGKTYGRTGGVPAKFESGTSQIKVRGITD
jgi:hypothetical protein